MLNTLGATDKYDLASGEPVFPDGYADADKTPRYPQTLAEILGGRVPLSATHSELPDGLYEAQVGALTAPEINWVAAE